MVEGLYGGYGTSAQGSYGGVFTPIQPSYKGSPYGSMFSPSTGNTSNPQRTYTSPHVAVSSPVTSAYRQSYAPAPTTVGSPYMRPPSTFGSDNYTEHPIVPPAVSYSTLDSQSSYSLNTGQLRREALMTHARGLQHSFREEQPSSTHQEVQAQNPMSPEVANAVSSLQETRRNYIDGASSYHGVPEQVKNLILILCG